MLEIDGSRGEGGGQVLRTAVALSLLTGTPFRMTAIRAGREKPGLKAQHLTILKTARRLWGCGVEGAELGAAEVSFQPAPVKGGTFEIDIGTAGSITLLLQGLVLPLCFAPGRSIVTLRGGTDVAWSPTFDYLRGVVCPHLADFAEEISVECTRRGFFPVGGGEVRLTVRPRFASWKEVRGALAPLALDEAGPVEKVEIRSTAAEDLREHLVAERQVKGVENALPGLRTRRELDYSRSASPGSAVTCIARLAGGARIGADALGERGKRAEQVGREAAEQLKAQLAGRAPVDVHLADHLVPWLAIRGGGFRATELSDHARTNAEISNLFLPAVTIDEAARTFRSAAG